MAADAAHSTPEAMHNNIRHLPQSGGCFFIPPGVKKSLKMDKTQTGGPSHAQKWVFKYPIDPSDIKILKSTDNF